MRDPLEGLGPDETIRTGADRAQVPAAFEPVLDDLVAAAGIVSVRTDSWTTDRATAVDTWVQIADYELGAMRTLLGWAGGSSGVERGDLITALSHDGIVHRVAERFATEIGVWT